MSQQPQNANLTTALAGFFTSILEILISKETGRVAIDRVLVLLLIFTMWFSYAYRDDIFQSIIATNQNAAVEIYIKTQEQNRIKQLGQEVRTNSQRLLSLLKPDIVAVWIYKPQRKHYFMELVYYEGELPFNTQISDYSRISVDRISTEYYEHSNGMPFISNGLESDELTRITKANKGVYSCPIYNRYGYYEGKISMYWPEFKSLSDTSTRMYHIECTRAARQIGRHLDTNDELLNTM